jgi:hypothetical protein
MARDIFNRDVDLGQPLAADAVRALLGDTGESDLMMQSIQIQYAQRVTRLWELGSAKTFFFAGRTEGSIGAKRIIGKTNASMSFIKQYGDVCNVQKNSIGLTLKAGCTEAGNLATQNLTASGCVIQSCAYSVQAQDMVINEEVSLMFARLNDPGSAT